MRTPVGLALSSYNEDSTLSGRRIIPLMYFWHEVMELIIGTSGLIIPVCRRWRMSRSVPVSGAPWTTLIE